MWADPTMSQVCERCGQQKWQHVGNDECFAAAIFKEQEPMMPAPSEELTIAPTTIEQTFLDLNADLAAMRKALATLLTERENAMARAERAEAERDAVARKLKFADGRLKRIEGHAQGWIANAQWVNTAKQLTLRECAKDVIDELQSK